MDQHTNEAYRSCLFPLSVAMGVLLTISQALRFWSHGLLPRNKFGLDDWASLCARICLLAWFCTFIFAHSGSHHTHVWQFGPAELEKILKPFVFGIQAYNAGLFFIRSSALLFYRRVFDKASSTFRLTVWAGLILNLIWVVIWITVMALFCRPVRKLWDQRVPGTCFSTEDVTVANSVSTVALDLYILILPMPMLWKLRLSLAKKTSVILVLMVVYASLVLSAGRLAAFSKAGEGLNTDAILAYAPVLKWNIFEASFGMISINLPSILHLVRRGYQGGFVALFHEHELYSRVNTEPPRPRSAERGSYKDDTEQSLLGTSRVQLLEDRTETPHLSIPLQTYRNDRYSFRGSGADLSRMAKGFLK